VEAATPWLLAQGRGGGENDEPRVAVTHLKGAESVATGEGAVAHSMDAGSAVAEAGPGKTNAQRREPQDFGETAGADRDEVSMKAKAGRGATLAGGARDYRIRRPME
jgi:hypothetical protein